MKLSILILVVTLTSALATESYSQTKLLDVNLNNSTVKEVLTNIEDQSEFYFMFSEKVVDVNREVSLFKENTKIGDVLNTLFAGTDVMYTVKDRIIVLTTPELIADLSDLTFQEKTVTGKITDNTGAPLPGATVVIKGTLTGEVANPDGVYTISEVPEGATLIYSFIGMVPKEVLVGSQTTIDITLEEETINMEEIVVIGYSSKEKASLTAAVTTVNIENLETRPITHLATALTGTSTGVTTFVNSSQPGMENTSIMIRGFNTINDASPLVLIDGIVGSMNDVSPNDVDQISILKSGAAAAVYGSRAANGVILVTTKRGIAGD